VQYVTINWLIKATVLIKVLFIDKVFKKCLFTLMIVRLSYVKHEVTLQKVFTSRSHSEWMHNHALGHFCNSAGCFGF